MCGIMDGLSEPLIDRIRGELYVRRIVASSWSERDMTVGVRVCFFLRESGWSYT